MQEFISAVLHSQVRRRFMKGFNTSWTSELKKSQRLFQCLPTQAFKGTVASDFVGPFLAYLDRSGREKEPSFLFLNFSITPLIFKGHLKFVKCLIPKHLWDSWKIKDRYTNVGSGSRRFPISFLENRWQGVNSSRRWIYSSSILLETRLQICVFFPVC